MLTAAQVLDRETWRSLAPGLDVEGGDAVTCALPGPDAIADLRREGYLDRPGAVPPEIVAALAEGVRALVAADVMPVFLWMYATPWRMFGAFDPLLRAALGDYRVLPEIWTWFVPPSDDGAGWYPHRDQRVMQVAEDGSSHSVTLWIPLTDATALNGCMYLVPMNVDEEFRYPGTRTAVKRPQDIRAVPATAGSLLAWNGNVLHWGGRSSRRAPRPRVSIACQFQRARDPVLGRPLLAPGAVPSLEMRAFLVARALLGYGQVALSAPVRALAEELKAILYERIANG